MNAYVQELAQCLLMKERAFLDPTPLGVPLQYIPLDNDAPFHSMELKRLELK